MPIRVVTIEDDPQYRSSLELLFRRAADFELVGSFGSPDAALSRLTNDGGTVDWQLVLMDVDLPGMDGIACTRRIKQRLPDTAVVVLTVFEERATIVEAICAGADGYLLKRTPASELLGQLRAITEGGAPISARVARTVLDLVSAHEEALGTLEDRKRQQLSGTARHGRPLWTLAEIHALRGEPDETASLLRRLLDRYGPGEVPSAGYLERLRPGLVRHPAVAAVYAERDRRVEQMRREVREELERRSTTVK